VNSESVAEIPEGRLLPLLYHDRIAHSWIVPPYPGPVPAPVFETPLAGLIERTPPLRGDVDLLVIPVDSPHQATALQFKRVKVGSSSYTAGIANKLPEIAKLARQANHLVPLGFYRVCATVLILVDSRETPAANPWMKSTPPAVIEAVNAQVLAARFDVSVRVQVIEICQPLDVDFRWSGMSGGRVFQAGSTRTQPKELTRSVYRLIHGSTQ
jgi:hypothetical protein